MFGKPSVRQPKVETKQYSVSQEDVSEIAKLAQGEYIVQKIFTYCLNGFNREIGNIQKNITAKLAIDTEKYDVDWGSLFKDSKIYTRVKPPKPEPKPEGKEDAKS